MILFIKLNVNFHFQKPWRECNKWNNILSHSQYHARQKRLKNLVDTNLSSHRYIFKCLNAAFMRHSQENRKQYFTT